MGLGWIQLCWRPSGRRSRTSTGESSFSCTGHCAKSNRNSRGSRKEVSKSPPIYLEELLPRFGIETEKPRDELRRMLIGGLTATRTRCFPECRSPSACPPSACPKAETPQIVIDIEYLMLTIALKKYQGEPVLQLPIPLWPLVPVT
jgi:hypothetical protein